MILTRYFLGICLFVLSYSLWASTNDCIRDASSRMDVRSTNILCAKTIDSSAQLNCWESARNVLSKDVNRDAKAAYLCRQTTNASAPIDCFKRMNSLLGEHDTLLLCNAISNPVKAYICLREYLERGETKHVAAEKCQEMKAKTPF